MVFIKNIQREIETKRKRTSLNLVSNTFSVGDFFLYKRHITFFL
jgi:hypothetical protein